MISLQSRFSDLKSSPKTWLVTGSAGFIGTNLVRHLLELNQKVRGLDNFSTGSRKNIEYLKSLPQGENFQFFEGDVQSLEDCEKAVSGAEITLHQAALGSVPRSIEAPLPSHNSNMTGCLNMLWAAKKSGCRRFVYASSSSVYGDEPNLPKVEERIGKPLSPYAATKLADEIYAAAFANSYGLETVGLRYFNVFGPHQSPEGPYAAVIPRWTENILKGKPVTIFGDGETSRDFCYVENVVQINILAGITANTHAVNQVYNVACGHRTTLKELHDAIQEMILVHRSGHEVSAPLYQKFRTGDIRHSLADISKAKSLLGYEPTDTVQSGLQKAMDWYINDLCATHSG